MLQEAAKTVVGQLGKESDQCNTGLRTCLSLLDYDDFQMNWKWGRSSAYMGLHLESQFQGFCCAFAIEAFGGVF